MGGLSITHLLVVLIIALLLFGAGRVSEIGKGLGEGIRNFKKGIREEEEAEEGRAPILTAERRTPRPREPGR
ncbi:MAG: twin-arginine translocase TatA/TatE family subunit [Minicystis sp.]